MEDISLKNILDDIFGNDIKDNDKESFISFLKICGAYHEFIKHFNIERFKSYKEIVYENDAYFAFYNILINSFPWRDTYDGYSFWYAMSRLHHLILYVKYKKKLIKPNLRLTYRMKMDNTFLSEEFEIIKYDLNKSKVKNKNIYMFLSKLKVYFKEIGLI